MYVFLWLLKVTYIAAIKYSVMSVCQDLLVTLYGFNKHKYAHNYQ